MADTFDPKVADTMMKALEKNADARGITDPTEKNRFITMEATVVKARHENGELIKDKNGKPTNRMQLPDHQMPEQIEIIDQDTREIARKNIKKNLDTALDKYVAAAHDDLGVSVDKDFKKTLMEKASYLDNDGLKEEINRLNKDASAMDKEGKGEKDKVNLAEKSADKIKELGDKFRESLDKETKSLIEKIGYNQPEEASLKANLSPSTATAPEAPQKGGTGR